MRLRPLLPLLLLLTACPEFEEQSWRFDLRAQQGELRYRDLRAQGDPPEEILRGLVSEYLDGQALEEANPGWKEVRKELLEVDGRLDGLVRFGFDDPARAGLYKHDRKSPWIWCSEDRAARVIRTNGTDISEVLPGCVAWSRKATVLEVTVGHPPPQQDSRAPPTSLLEAWRTYSAGPPDSSAPR